MNLLELLPKDDRNVRVEVWDTAAAEWKAHPEPGTLLSKLGRAARALDGSAVPKAMVRGLVLEPGMRVRVRRASSFWPNFAQGEGQFQFCTLRSTAAPAKVVLAWRAEAAGATARHAEVDVGEELAAVAVPPAPGPDLELVITVPPQVPVKIFFGVHRVLDRDVLFSRCKGVGVEVGPGPKPQILPGPETQVTYLEQASPEDWQRLYGEDTRTPVDPELWKHYAVGNADHIPAAPGSLDFIFSSHVIEHLANPLGHLAYWGKLLKKGGVVAAVIPDMQGCEDYVFQPSSVAELEAEYEGGSMEPTLAHYQRWCRVRAAESDPAQVLAAGRSIHVHFYTPQLMRQVLQANHRKLGYASAQVVSSPNHKDFFVLLER